MQICQIPILCDYYPLNQKTRNLSFVTILSLVPSLYRRSPSFAGSDPYAFFERSNKNFTIANLSHGIGAG